MKPQQFLPLPWDNKKTDMGYGVGEEARNRAAISKIASLVKANPPKA